MEGRGMKKEAKKKKREDAGWIRVLVEEEENKGIVVLSHLHYILKNLYIRKVEENFIRMGNDSPWINRFTSIIKYVNIS